MSSEELCLNKLWYIYTQEYRNTVEKVDLAN